MQDAYHAQSRMSLLQASAIRVAGAIRRWGLRLITMIHAELCDAQGPYQNAGTSNFLNLETSTIRHAQTVPKE